MNHCKHCPPTCQTQHVAPTEEECADCLNEYERFLDSLVTFDDETPMTEGE